MYATYVMLLCDVDAMLQQWTEKEYVYEKRQQYWQEHSHSMQGNMAQLLEQIEALENRCLALAAQLMERQKASQMVSNEQHTKHA